MLQVSQLSGFGGSVEIIPQELTQKGYGSISSGDDVDLTMSYGTVESGSAPAAGDLVVWMVLAADSGGQAILDVTGDGWTQTRAYTDTFLCSSIIAKVVTAGDLSGPPQIVNNPQSGSCAFWVAYTVSGSIGSLATPLLNADYAGASNTGSQSVDSSALDEPNVAITIGGGGGSDGSPSTTMSGATADITSNVVADWGSSVMDSKFVVNATIGGASITVSKSSDDSSANHLASGYVSVTFA